MAGLHQDHRRHCGARAPCGIRSTPAPPPPPTPPPGAVIVALDHQPVRSPEDLTRLVAGCPVGRAVSLEYVLLGGVQRRAEVELKPLDAPLRQALMAR